MCLCLASGCAFYNHVVVSEDGKFLPWWSKRDDASYKKGWRQDRAEWEVNNAETRFQAGELSRSDFNRIRREHGLPPVD